MRQPSSHLRKPGGFRSQLEALGISRGFSSNHFFSSSGLDRGLEIRLYFSKLNTSSTAISSKKGTCTQKELYSPGTNSFSRVKTGLVSRPCFQVYHSTYIYAHFIIFYSSLFLVIHILFTFYLQAFPIQEIIKSIFTHPIMPQNTMRKRRWKEGLQPALEKPNERGTGIPFPSSPLFPSLKHVPRDNEYPLCIIPKACTGLDVIHILLTCYSHSNDLPGIFAVTSKDFRRRHQRKHPNSHDPGTFPYKLFFRIWERKFTDNVILTLL